MTRKLSAADIAEIHQTIALIAHVYDNRELDALNLVFTDDVELELGYGEGVHLLGIESVRELFSQRQPDGADHQTVNTLILTDPDGTVRTHSRYIALRSDGTTTNGDYLSVVVPTERGWRIRYFRSVLRYPLEPEAGPRPTAITDEWRLTADRLPVIVN
ncbi:nuclear transport factor 2 family protein [Candidatus Protofrankia californiensis]|uniref:nuclear transport factor 2 family protein n=1 Tax=Candidatus Protofrankia californiensis TaxID=1839754 RepID=UPI001041919B|nr:nuclear transport factor 2 family protein [Candidatus Protofrankia californiensis]